MPRQARKKSETGIYHVMIRGINQQKIFEDEEDNHHFLEIIKKYKAICGYEIYAYCLMDNHVHLLIKEGSDTLSQIFKRIGSSYVYWYNRKYKRSGHLFQDRYKSEAVDEDQYLLTVLRYIHQNPEKAGICSGVEGYAFSSYQEYLNPKQGQITDTKLVLEMMSENQFIEFHQKDNMDCCLDIESKLRLTDEEAQNVIYEISHCRTADQFRLLDIPHRDFCIKEFKNRGISIRQISRLTGVSKGVVEKI